MDRIPRSRYTLHFFPYPWILKEKKGIELLNESILKLKNNGISIETDICGFILETFQGWGAIFYPKEFVQEIKKFVRK